MANTYTSLHFHVVFTTKNRAPFITADVAIRLWPYLGGIARDQGLTALAIGGVEDHVHLLLRMPPTVALALAIKEVKGASSRWMHSQGLREFGWQDGYGAFTLSATHLDAAKRYIAGQPDHHTRHSFADEYRKLLERNGVEYEERYLLD